MRQPQEGDEAGCVAVLALLGLLICLGLIALILLDTFFPGEIDRVLHR